jgi:flagellin FlaB
MRKIVKNEEAFTGLEAAIVLIAFVVVAAVFSYVVLGAGFFTTEKSQEVVHAGVASAASNIVVKGNVYGLANDGLTGIETLQFDVGLAAGGLPIDMNKTIFVYSDTGTTPVNLAHGTDGALPAAVSTWVVRSRSEGTDNVLQYGETFTIQAKPPAAISPRTAFSVEIKPEIGASLAVSRTVPPSITNTTILY